MPLLLPSGNIQCRLVSEASVEVVLMQGQPALPVDIVNVMFLIVIVEVGPYPLS